MKRLITIILSIILAIQPLTTYAVVDVDKQPFSDIKGHWAETTIKKHYKLGMLKGYPNGMFKPDQKMTRAELISLINRYLGLKEKANTNFTDVPEEKWYSDDAAKAKYYQYVEELQLRPAKLATREDVITMMSLILDVEEQKVAQRPIKFDDLKEVDVETKEKIEKFSQMGYINGYDDSTFKPEGTINRAELMTIMENTLGYIVQSQENIDNMPEGVKKVTIINPNIVIEDKNISGNLYISPGANGNVTIKDTKVEGQIEIAGGKTNKPIELENVETEKIVVTKAKETPKVEIKGKNKISELKTKSETDIEILGETTIKEITTQAKTKLELGEKTEVTTLITEKETNIETQKGSKITKLETKTKTKVSGPGEIKKAYIKNEEVEIESKPKYTKVDDNIGQANIGGKKINSQNDDYDSSSGNSSGGSSNTSKKPVHITGVKIDGGDRVLNINEELQLMAVITPSNASNKKVTWTSSEKSIVEVTENGLIKTAAPGESIISVTTQDGNYKDSIKVNVELPAQGTQIVVDGVTYIGIWCIEDLVAMQNDLSAKYILMNDLDMENPVSYRNPKNADPDGDGPLIAGGSMEELKPNGDNPTNPGFDSIGIQDSSFTGVFDGNQKDIKNLYINDSNRATCKRNVGLFGYTNGAEIKNVRLINVNIIGINSEGGLVGSCINSTIDDIYVTGNVIGNNDCWTSTGGLVGSCINSTISNAKVTANVSGRTNDAQGTGGLVGSCTTIKIENSYTTGDVIGGGEGNEGNTGGLVGHQMSSTTVLNSYATGNVQGTRNIGGLIGQSMAHSIIDNCYATGSVKGTSGAIGGLVGYNAISSITNCYALGKVEGNIQVGGLVGVNGIGEITNSYADGNVSGTNSVGGLVGLGYKDGKITNSYAGGNVSGTNNVGGLVGEDSGKIINTYAIGNVSGTNNVGGLVGEESGEITNTYADGSVRGTNGVGGLVGKGKGRGIINCVAFNESVSIDGVYSGRVLGNGRTGLAGLYAYGDMLINDQKVTEVGINTAHGANCYGNDFKAEIFFTKEENWNTKYGSVWDFTDVWKIKNGMERPTFKWDTNDDGMLGFDATQGAIIDTTAPTAGNAATLTISNEAENSIDISWTKATDNTSTQSALQYLMYYSTYNGLDTIKKIEADGTAIGTYEANIDTKKVEELNSSTTYYFNVIVKDEAGNKTAYTEVSGTTQAETTSNNVPIATNDTVQVDVNQNILINVLSNDTDEDEDSLIISIYTQGTNGTVMQEGNSLKYTPNADYAGNDSFTYTISDGKGGSSTATVSVEVNQIPF